MNDQEEEDAAPNLRVLKTVVIVLGIMILIVLGIIISTIVVRAIRMAEEPVRTPGAPVQAGHNAGTVPVGTLSIPPGSRIGKVTATDRHMIVESADTDRTTRLIVVDIRTGETLYTLDIAEED